MNRHEYVFIIGLSNVPGSKHHSKVGSCEQGRMVHLTYWSTVSIGLIQILTVTLISILYYYYYTILYTLMLLLTPSVAETSVSCEHCQSTVGAQQYCWWTILCRHWWRTAAAAEASSRSLCRQGVINCFSDSGPIQSSYQLHPIRTKDSAQICI